MLSVSLGNIFTASVNSFILNQDGSSKLEGAEYFYFSQKKISRASRGFFMLRFYPVNPQNTQFFRLRFARGL